MMIASRLISEQKNETKYCFCLMKPAPDATCVSETLITLFSAERKMRP